MTPTPTLDTRLVVQTWLGTRLLFALVAIVVAGTGSVPLARVLAHWDAAHFMDIANKGYFAPQEMAFFPGLPLLLRGGATLGIPMPVTGVLLALVCSLLAALALGRLGGTSAAIAWLLAPTGVFTAVVYTEAPFTAAAFWAWERATRGRWGQAAALAAVACTFRVSGLFLIGALAVLLVVHWWGSRAMRSPRPARALPSASPAPGTPAPLNASPLASAAFLLIPVAVLVAYAVYLYALTGSWTAWFSAQEAGWQRGFHWPWEALRHAWTAFWTHTPGRPEWIWMFRAELVVWVIGLVTTGVLLVRRRLAQASWIGVQVLAFSLSYWLMSVPRAALLWFPLWILVGEAADRHTGRGATVVKIVVVVLALVLQNVWAWLYFTGRWAG